MRAQTTISPAPHLIVVSDEKTTQLCGTTMDAAMDAAATRTRARTAMTLTALLSAYTSVGRAAPALRAHTIDQVTRTLDSCSCAMWEDTKWWKAVATATRIHTMATLSAPCPVNTATNETPPTSRVHKIDHLACARPMLLYSSSHIG